jgi:beta-lactamase superfamily II metal-dependent hydrolase
MPFEIDFLPVGEGERSGDAIAMRFWEANVPGSQRVFIIDGGTKDSGEKLVEHVESVYGTSTVDAAFCTHSDGDHASGLSVVLERLDVRRLCMHLPWNHVSELEEQFRKSASSNAAQRHFMKSLEHARELEKLARSKNIPVVELFSDGAAQGQIFTILGPSKEYYRTLLQSFRCAEELGLQISSLLEKLVSTYEKTIKWVRESWSVETLAEPADGDCSAENNSSTVLLFTHSGSRFLFTSDAGVPALREALNKAAALNIDVGDIAGLQVPHHGSKHNVGPFVLDRIVGPRLDTSTKRKTAIVSASVEGAPRHPSRKVVNAFMRRGATVVATQGKTICFRSPDAPIRPGWSSAEGMSFFDDVEE